MWSKKNKEKEEKSVVKSRISQYETSNSNQTTRQTLSIRTTEQRSRSISYSISGSSSQHFATNFGPTSSLSSLDNNNLLALPSSTNSSLNKPSLDAKPVNLSYQSPYRNSPVYSSLRSSTSTPLSPFTPTTSTQLPNPMPSIVKPISTTKKKIVVKKTGVLYDGQSLVPTYETHSKNRGEVLIINNIMFKDKGYRHGAKADDENLKELFKQMGFKVSVERDLKKSGMVSKIKSFSQKNSLKNADIAILVVMSHGTKNETLGGTEIFGLDEEGVHVEDLLDYFNEESCKNMKGKPKIFIFQCCRGDNEQFIETDATRVPSKVPVLADALIAYSTLPGFLSHRDPIAGTWYISTLCEVFMQHAHEYHVEDLLKMVDVKLGALAKNVRQTTNYENRGFKRCFLHPQ